MSDYTDFQTRLAAMLATDTTNAKFVTLLPVIIFDAEQRIYRDLDFLATRTYRAVPLVATQRQLALPTTGKILVVLESQFVITPAATAPDAGQRNPLRRLSPDALDFIWSSALTAQGVPKYCALDDNATMRLAPTPDQAYQVELRGTFRPDPLSVGNPSTYLTVNYPDLFFAAAMYMASGYMRNFGAQSDNPAMALSWQTTYNDRKESAKLEALRQRGEGAGWAPYAPSPAQPPRT